MFKFLVYFCGIFNLLNGAKADWVNPVEIKGYKFFDSVTGESLLIKGVDYYPRPNFGRLNDNSVDFYTHEYRKKWHHDIKEFKKLGINAIRVYSVDPDNDHSEFMCALNEAGIYALVGLAAAGDFESITNKETPGCYSRALKARGERVINEFARYENTLGFSAGNEVNHFVPLGKRPQWNAPCLKKFVRDMRAYIFSCESIRNVPVGVVMADSDRDKNAAYYNCLTNKMDWLESAEWYGLNTYVYCDGAVKTYKEAVGFRSLVDSFKRYKYSIPVLLTEFGCLSQTFPTIDGYAGIRNFNQAKFMGSEKEVQEVFAGGFVFEYSTEKSIARTPYPFKEYGPQNYGLGYMSPEFCNDIDIPCTFVPIPAFDQLKAAYGSATENYVPMNRDDFWVEQDRAPKMSCPPDFPALTDFDWDPDKYPSLECPSIAKMTYTCPNKILKSPPFVISMSILGVIALVLIAKVLVAKFLKGGDKKDKEFSSLLKAENGNGTNYKSTEAK